MDQLSGHTWWSTDEGGSVGEVTISPSRIGLTLEFKDRAYTVVLGPAASGPSNWEGSWIRRNHPSRGLASGKLYRTAGGGLAIVGRWHEDNRVYRWVVELEGEAPSP